MGTSEELRSSTPHISVYPTVAMMEGSSAKSFDRGVPVGDTGPFSLTAEIDWGWEGASEAPVFFSSSFAGAGAGAGAGAAEV